MSAGDINRTSSIVDVSQSSSSTHEPQSVVMESQVNILVESVLDMLQNALNESPIMPDTVSKVTSIADELGTLRDNNVSGS